MADDKSTTSWWQTVPGILTGLAAIITAVTGLMIALNRTSTRSNAPTSVSRDASATSATPTRPPTNDATTSIGASPTGPKDIPLPEPHQATLDAGSAVVTILSARVEPIDGERRALTIRIRHRQVGPSSAVFGSRYYRLLVGDEILEPTNLISEVVANDSTKNGDFRFELPADAKDVVLQITGYSDGKSRIPLKLP